MHLVDFNLFARNPFKKQENAIRLAARQVMLNLCYYVHRILDIPSFVKCHSWDTQKKIKRQRASSRFLCCASYVLVSPHIQFSRTPLMRQLRCSLCSFAGGFKAVFFNTQFCVCCSRLWCCGMFQIFEEKGSERKERDWLLRKKIQTRSCVQSF